MKRLLVLFFILLLPNAALAALSAQTIWEVRTAGSATNGGGFVIGVTSKATGTDLAVSAGSNVSASSTSYGFTSADIGRWIKVTSGTGFTVGLYQVTGVATGVAILSASPAAISTTGGSFTVYWGLDYSQQNSANSGGSNGSVTDGVAAGTTTITSATASFTNDIIGNVIYVSGGTGSITAAAYEVTAFTNSTTVTVDRSTGLTAGTGVTINIGGATNSLNTLSGIMAASNKAFLKADGTYSMSSTATFAQSNNNTNSSLYAQLIGYTTARGDNGYATIQASAGGITNMISFTGGYWKLSNLIIDCNSQTTCTAVTSNSSGLSIENDKIKNFTVKGVNTSSTYQAITYSEFTGGVSGCTAATAAGNTAGGSPFVFGNYIHDNVCTGTVSGQNGNVVGNIFANNSGASSDGVQLTGPLGIIIYNTFYNNGRDAVRLTNFGPNNVINNVFVSNAGCGINFSSGAGFPSNPMMDGNAYYNNTGGTLCNLSDTGSVNSLNGSAPYVNSHDVILSGSPFVNPGAGNYALNTVAGQGAAIRSAGVPAGFVGLAGTTSYPTMGAVQPNTTNIVGGAYSFGQ